MTSFSALSGSYDGWMRPMLSQRTDAGERDVLCLPLELLPGGIRLHARIISKIRGSVGTVARGGCVGVY